MNYQEAIARRANNNQVTVADIKSMLGDHRGITLAGLTAVTDVRGIAAAHKGVTIQKVSEASVQMFNVIQDKDVYGKAVRRSALKDARNDAADVAAQQTQDNYYEHDADCHSVVYHRTTGEPYLYVFFNSGKSVYLVNGQVSDRATVAGYLQPAAARKIMEPQETFNVTDNIHHDVIVRVLKLSSVVELRARKQVMTV